MTRPNIVRADTLDLQDQDAPSASEHHRPAMHGGLAPHQRAEVHHVLEERSSEEHALADAWRMADDLTEEPGMIDEAQQQHQTTENHTANGGHIHGEDDREGAGSEVDADDDMMDRISSSPSIDDGGYIPRSSPPVHSPCRMVWPERKSSLSPSSPETPTSPRETFNQSASSSAGSSPFLQTPQHLPLHVRRTGQAASPLIRQVDWSSSPFDGSPRHPPLRGIKDTDKILSFTSEHHQKMGRYKPLPELDSNRRIGRDLRADEGFCEGYDHLLGLNMDCQQLNDQKYKDADRYKSKRSTTVSDPDLIASKTFRSQRRKNAFTQSLMDLSESTLEQSPSLTSIGSVDLQDVLLPVDDPLLDTPPSPTNSSGSWESLPTSEDDSMDRVANDDDTDALFINLDDRFIDSGWGGECLRETEDIDFEFVYALHTFVATVEGQANATKGDTMVLLDDSNSYWWLVRVVKDGSIGYLPAEHIETPTERLARLNKHRNIDLSASMLGDNSEKTRNPLKKLRRRNTKAVSFAAPTYVEASDYDWTDDEDEGAADGYPAGAQPEDASQNGERTDEIQTSEGPATQEEAPRASTPTRGSFDREQAATIASVADDPQHSPKLFDKTEAAPLKSRKTRNTDSFLKDDNLETRKITITPGLLREEQAAKASSSSEVARNESLEDIVKQVSPPEPLSKKDSKKEKEKKKDGIFKGFFKSKKKDKRAKDESDPIEEERSGEFSRESPVISPLGSSRSSPGPEASNGMLVADSRGLEVSSRPTSREKTPDQAQEPSTDAVAELEGSATAHEMEAPEQPTIDTVLGPQEKPKESALSPITNLLKRDDSKVQKPTKAKRAKARVELDDFDSPTDEEGPNPFEEQEDRAVDDDEADDERLSESPVEINSNSFTQGTDSVHVPTPSPDDQPSIEDDDDEPDSMTTSPSIIEHPAEPVESSSSAAQDDDDSTPRGFQSPNTAASEADKASTPRTRGLSTDSTSSSSNRLSPSTPVSQQSWSDSSLRAWLEDGSEIKDMMVMIHDKSGVVPVSDDHPMMAGLFSEQKKGVQDMMTQLDGLLGTYLQRKGIAFS